MKAPKKSFDTPRRTPVDVEYRLRRANETHGGTYNFLMAVDPEVFADDAHKAALAAWEELQLALDRLEKLAPKKAARKKKVA